MPHIAVEWNKNINLETYKKHGLNIVPFGLTSRRIDYLMSIFR